VSGSCEHGHELSGYIKGGKFLDWSSDYELSKKVLINNLTARPRRCAEYQRTHF